MITMQFVFSSEEYPEYVASNFNDAFGVWVNGSFVPVSITVQGNVAIDEVNAGKNKNLYHDKTSDQFNTEMDGFTYVISLKAPVNAGQVNTIKIGNADASDTAYDSNLLIMGASVQNPVRCATTGLCRWRLERKLSARPAQLGGAREQTASRDLRGFPRAECGHALSDCAHNVEVKRGADVAASLNTAAMGGC